MKTPFRQLLDDKATKSKIRRLEEEVKKLRSRGVMRKKEIAGLKRLVERMTLKDIFDYIQAFQDQNDCYRDDPLFRLAFVTEETGEFAKEVIRFESAGSSPLTIKDIQEEAATEVFDILFNLLGTLKSMGITASDLEHQARKKMKRNETRDFPTH